MAKSGKPEEYLFVEEDLEALGAKVAELERAYKDELSGVHDSTTQSSETWHDNPAFDEVQQRSKMLYSEYSKMNTVLIAAKLISKREPDINIVGIGSRVRVIMNEKFKDEFVVCSYRCFHESDEYVSYSSPVGAALLGARSGDRVSYQVGDRRNKIEVTEIVS